MPLSVVQQDNVLVPYDESEELVRLPEVPVGSPFFSPSGRTYRLFGNEENAFSIPVLPEIPPILVAPKASALTLEEALEQIEMFSSPKTHGQALEQPKQNQAVQTSECICSTVKPSLLQLFQALGDPVVPSPSADIVPSLKLVKSENTAPKATLSAEEVVHEVSQVLPGAIPSPPPTPKRERRWPLRVISDHAEEPFIVPFTKPPSSPEEIKEVETKSVTLKIVKEFIPPIPSTTILKQCRHHHRKEKALCRKHFSLPQVSAVLTEVIPPTVELPIVSESRPPVDTSMFRWSSHLDSLMNTADNQIRMLTDHLVVQQHQGTKAICFKSVFPGDGCSTILLCAVRALMERNYRILLIDAHHQHIDLPQQLNLSGNFDLGNEVIAVNDRLGIWVWQETQTLEENTALIAEIVTEHRERYDLILLDNGSVTESPLTNFIMFWDQVELNGVIMIANTKRPSEVPISHIARRLRHYGIPLIGIAENYV